MRNELSNRLGLPDIHKICIETQGDSHRMSDLYQLTFDADDRVAFNALWVFTHFDIDNTKWLYQKQDDLINRVLCEKNITKCRLMLVLLSRLSFTEENLRSDFIDYCIAKITACSQPYGVRALCIKLAWEQMKFHPELLAELKLALEMLEQETLSPGLASAKRQVMKKMNSIWQR